eukprot:gene584-8092_t
MKVIIFFLWITMVICYQNCKTFGTHKLEWTVDQSENLDVKISFINTKDYGYVSVGFNSLGNTMSGQGNALVGFSNKIYEYMMIGYMAPVLIPKSISNDTLVTYGNNVEMSFLRPLQMNDDQHFEIKNETTTLMFAFHDKIVPPNENEVAQHTKTEKYEINWFIPEKSC